MADKSDSDPVVSTGQSCLNCSKSAALLCPVCKKMGLRSPFCGHDCFKDGFKSHKKLHEVADQKPFVFPPGTKDGFPRLKYTGPLRAVYPIEEVPRRKVLDTVELPDYAKAVSGRSLAERLDQKNKLGKRLNKREIAGMREVCRLGREVLEIAAASLRVGITTLEVDQIVHQACMERDSYPSPLNYRQFPRSVCTSVNEVICHGIPDARPLEDGDIINLDISLYHKGFHSDLNATYPIGNVSPTNLALIKATRECLDEAIRVCKPGYLFRDVGEVIEATAKKRGFTVNKTYNGHGVNQLFHTSPVVPHYAGSKASGTMKPGMTFTIEPMICVGASREIHWPDGWTAVTIDGKPSAQFEETLLITEDGVEVLTAQKGWKLPEKQV